MTCYTSALSTVAYASAASTQPSSSYGAAAAVRLFSLRNQKIAQQQRNKNSNHHHPRLSASSTSKIVHFVRHAEGTHNLNEEESKKPQHFDATLTPRGMEQCRQLSQHTKQLTNVEAVLVSPLRRCLDTSRLSFPHLYNNNHMDDETKDSNNNVVPFIALEEWRETVNYLCDCRHPTSHLIQNYPRVDFDALSPHEHDPIWSHYEQIHGSHEDHKSLRESRDAQYLYDRVHMAWKTLLRRPERELALVGHSAFFMHMFTPLFEELEGVVQYEDDDVKDLMTSGLFANCELRSVVVDIPI